MKNIIETIYNKDCIIMREFFCFVFKRENANDIHTPLKKHHPNVETNLQLFAISISGEINMSASPKAQMLAVMHKAK